MSWEHRDWSRPDARGILARLDRRWLPRPATAAALALLLVGMVALAFAGLQSSDRVVLRGDVSHPGAILLHVFAANGAFQACLVLVSIGLIGDLVERRVGALRVALLALLGAALAGLAYFSVGRLAPQFAAYPLVAPFGTLAALGVCAWHVADAESVAVFGTLVGLRRSLLIAAAIPVGLALFAAGPGALAWLAALAAGGASAPLVKFALAARPQTRAPAPRANPQPAPATRSARRVRRR